MRPKHYFTIDVEDWYQVYYARKVVPEDAWEKTAPQIERMIDATLEVLSASQTQATFFFVGWLAKHHAPLLRRVSALGHEIGSHGFWHTECHTLSAADLKVDIFDSKAALEEAIGKKILGFRAPGFSIQTIADRALDLIQEAGYVYDSSVLGNQASPYQIRPKLLEIPPNAVRLGRSLWPVNGGAFFRLVPYAFYRRYVQGLERSGVPLNFYIHSWELFTEYPRLALGFPKSFIQYHNLRSVRPKVEALLKEFSFSSIERQVDLLRNR